ncbi:hypothetical protein BN1723_010938 [Verticillium longisporum]|uniref:Uncharacterized protein n=1 Tax=Verticillium longisporum TaxID=100787 RepID=A0A0G4L2U0_VERLO|nr:hypothetical protein BN1723_010938 [Verticillium longisporum]
MQLDDQQPSPGTQPYHGFPPPFSTYPPDTSGQHMSRILNLDNPLDKSPYPAIVHLPRSTTPHPHHRLSLLRYLFPQSLRERYRERLLGFHLDTLPYYKHRLQSRIYQYILKRQRKPGVAAAVRTVFRRGRGLLLGPNPGSTGTRPARYARTRSQQQNKSKRKMPTLPGFGGGPGAYGSDPVTAVGGGRRRKLAAMANNMYRAGATAVNEIREGYAHIPRAGELTQDDGLGKTTIPGSFPDVAITVQGNDQMC